MIDYGEWLSANPGIDAWASTMEPRIATLEVPVWGSAVAGDPDGFQRIQDLVGTALVI